MSFLAPVLLAFLVLIPIVILIYFLRPQRRREIVSSTLLWRNLPRDVEVQTRIRRPPITLLLILQLIALGLGALALSRPIWSDTNGPTRQTIVVLDGSASMNATDVSPTRFEEAKRQARSLLSNTGSDVAGAVVLAGARAQLLASGTDRVALMAAIDSAQVSDGPADLQSAWALAGSLASARPEAGNEVVLLSDGAFDGDPGPIPATSRFILIGQSGNNQAITHIGVRRPFSGAVQSAAFVRVANYSDQAVSRVLRSLGDNLQFKEETVNLAARGTVDIVVQPPPGTRVYSAVLAGTDTLPNDDRAESLLAQGQDREVLLVSTAPDVLARALRANPDVNLRIERPEDYREPGRAALVVFDKFLPTALPNTPMLIVSPPVPSFLADTRTGRPGYAVSVAAESPLLKGVDLAPVEFGAVTRILMPNWAAPVVNGPDGPLILEGDRSGRRAVILAFDPLASNIPKLVAFPALLANAVDWLAPAQEGSLSAGSVARLPAGMTGEVVGPDGSVQPVSALDGATDRAGRYVLRRLGADSPTLFAVNVTDEVESAIAPQPKQAPPAAPVTSLAAPQAEQDGFPFAPWLLAIAFLVVSAEWWFFCRGRV